MTLKMRTKPPPPPKKNNNKKKKKRKNTLKASLTSLYGLTQTLRLDYLSFQFYFCNFFSSILNSFNKQ